MDRKIRVCLIIEGSYPFITGGVSSWVNQLIHALPEIDFILYSISPKENQELQYKMPENITAFQDLVISSVIKSQKKPQQKEKLLREIEKIHDLFRSGSHPHLEEIVRLMPENYFLHEDAVASDTGWNMITANNQLHNPVYPFADYFWSWLSAHNMLFSIIGTKPPAADIYHAISTGYAGLAAVFASIKTGKPLLLTEHGLYHKERELEIQRAGFVKGYQRDMWKKIYYGLSRLTYHYASVIISLFEHNRRLQIELGASAGKCRVIPNGINIEYFAGIKREKRVGFHIGLVGRVVPIKDIKCFILSCRIIAELIPAARFYCIGPTDEDPTYYADCEVLVESFRIADKFSFTGKQDVRDYYKFLDVVMLTSVREAQPLVILEAYAAGIPVVSTRVGNVPELLDYDERFMAAPKDADKLARGVRYIHNHPQEIKEIIKKNYEKTCKFYDRKELHKTYGALYAEFAGS